MKKYLLWHLLAGTRGGISRIKIINELIKRPFNAHQLAAELRMDYKTIRHHLSVLLDNHLILISKKDQYGAVYFLSPFFELNKAAFYEIWGKINKQLNKK